MGVIIVEGVVATGKSAVVRAIEQSAVWQQRPTKLIVSEHFTERVLELTEPKIVDRQELLWEHLRIAQTMHNRFSASRFKEHPALAPLIVYDRFHITHAAQTGSFAPFAAIDQALTQLPTVLVFLHHPPAKLLPNILATVSTRHPMWQRWLASLGDDAAIERYFLRLQDQSWTAFDRSQLTKIGFAAYSHSPAAIAEEALALLETAAVS